MLLAYLVYAAVFQGHFPRSIRDLMFLDSGFGVADEEQMERSMRSMEEVVSCSEAARTFSLARNADRRSANLLALCVEEMAGNIIRWGFSDGKPHTIDLRLIHKGDAFTLRIRDDCKPFNPQKQAELYRAGNGPENYGLRMVSKTVREMRYINMMNMNILFLTI